VRTSVRAPRRPGSSSRSRAERRDWANWDAERQAVYEQLLKRGVDFSALTDLLLRYGPGLLDRDLPYLVTAIRRAAIDEQRREWRQARIAQRASEEPKHPSLLRDPAEVVLARSALSAAVGALATIDEADAWALWWHAAGFSDEEISQRWTEAGFKPTHPSAALLRKRRERARSRLRAEMEERARRESRGQPDD
jgi:hypothetical protein